MSIKFGEATAAAYIHAVRLTADATLLRHYGRFIHADAAQALELSKIDSDGPGWAQFVPPRDNWSKAPPLVGTPFVMMKG